MAVYRCPITPPGFQWEDATGAPLVNGFLLTYLAGTTTPATTYSDATGGTPNPIPTGNPFPNQGGIQLDAEGRLPNIDVWLSTGQAYKFVLWDQFGTLIATVDNIAGVNDPSAFGEWVNGPAPTYTGASSFTLVGDWSAILIASRGMLLTCGSTVFNAYVATVSYNALTNLTTITIGAYIGSITLTNPISKMQYALLAGVPQSIPHRVTNVVLASCQMDDSLNNIGPADLASPGPGTTSLSNTATDIWGAALAEFRVTNGNSSLKWCLGGGAARNLVPVGLDVGLLYASGVGTAIAAIGSAGTLTKKLLGGSLYAIGQTWRTRFLIKSTGTSDASFSVYFGPAGTTGDTLVRSATLVAGSAFQYELTITYLGNGVYTAVLTLINVTTGAFSGTAILINQTMNGSGVFSADTFLTFAQTASANTQVTLFQFRAIQE